MMIEESESPDVGSQSDASDDVLAERRARRAEAGDPTVMRRADAAEAAVRNLETHLAALERRLEEVGRERERIAQQLAERESDVRDVKQREFAEQQLRVEAEQRSERLQRDMRAEIQELGSRLEETERHVRELDAELVQLRERDARLVPIVRELMDVAAGLRTGFERELAALREELQQQVVWERETYVRELTAMGARMEDLRFELTRTADDLRAQLAAEPPDAGLLQHTTEPDSEREAAHRREMADALVAAVERLRTRVAEVKEAEAVEAEQPHVERPYVEQPPVEQPHLEEPAVAEPVVEAPIIEPLAVEPPVVESSVVEPPVVAPSVVAPSVVEPPVAEAPVVEPPVVEPPAVQAEEAKPAFTGYVPAAGSPLIARAPVVTPTTDESPVLDTEPESASADEPSVEEPPIVELSSQDVSVGAGPREEPPAPESPLSGLSPGGAVSAKVVTSKPVARQSRLLSVPEKRTSWLAPAIRKLAAQRDAKLAAELVIELIPAQRGVVDGHFNYEIKINELGTFYVTLDPAQATISREPRGSVDFSLEGSVAAFSELAAGGMSRRRPGLRIRKGRRRARALLKTRRQPIALADLAAGQIDVWPGLLLLVMAEAIDPSWTTGRRFELAFDMQGTSAVTIYIRICDGEPILVSRTPVGQPVATISLSGHALICLLAGTQAPAEHKIMVTGDATSVDMFLQWTARAQGLSVASA
jgi:predicted  nucleic acid-binding Zn-ribbon protein